MTFRSGITINNNLFAHHLSAIPATVFPVHEMFALSDLYNSTNGSHWKWRHPAPFVGHRWNFSKPNANPCVDQWQGVACGCASPPCNCTLSNCYISALQLPFFSLDGTLPTTIAYLQHMENLELGYNLIHGTLPTTLGSLANLSVIALFANKINGTIPSALGSLTGLKLLSLAENCLQGSIPTQLSALSRLTNLALFSNLLSGSIPTELAALSSLTFLELSLNKLSGSIPSELGAMTNLAYLALFLNFLTGYVPSELGDLTRLNVLVLSYNSLVGFLPSSLGALTRVAFFEVSYNALTGSLPSTLGAWAQLTYLGVDNNRFTSSIPCEIGAFSVLVLLDMAFNLLSGSLPAEVSGLWSATDVALNNNLLSGSLVDQLGEMTSLLSLQLQCNLFSQQLPTSIAKLTRLHLLFVFENMFTGSLENIAPTAAGDPTALSNLDVSNNFFSGSMPFERFRGLLTFAGIGNCFDVSLVVTESICSMQNITSLALDGLHTASRCQSMELTIGRMVSATIPPCLFNMPSLQTLHLSGNGLVGSVPSDVVIGPNLRHVSLSHNQLSNSIPALVQRRPWGKLDLSFNKFSGNIASFSNDARFNMSLDLNVNRLSGVLPLSLQRVQNISMLEGNMFECDYLRASIPKRDERSGMYSCGSNTFNRSAYAAVVGGLVCLTGTFIWFWRALRSNDGEEEETGSTLKWNLSDYGERWVKRRNVGRFLQCMRSIRHICNIWIAFFTVLLLPLYIALKMQYGTYDEQYAWTSSGALLKGMVPGMVMIGVWIVTVAMVMTSQPRFQQHHASTTISSEESVSSVTPRSWWMLGALIVAALVNVAVVGGVNVGFVFVALRGDYYWIRMCEVGLAFFKVSWNALVVRVLFGKNRIASTLAEDSVSSTSDVRAIALVVIVLFNTVIAPCVTTAFIDPTCFKYAFTRLPSVQSTFEYIECTSYFIPPVDDDHEGQTAPFCAQYDSISQSHFFDPPFIYYYECSSAVVIRYTSVYMYALLMSVIMRLPWLDVLAWMTRRRGDGDGDDPPSPLEPQRALAWLCPGSPAQKEGSTRPSKLFDVHMVQLVIISNMSVMVTFGVIFPLLGWFCFLVTSWQTLAFEMSILRFVHLVETTCSHFDPPSGNGDDAVGCPVWASQHAQRLDADCEGIASPLILFKALATLCGFFCAFFVFDIIGDEAGFTNALYGAVAMSAATVVLVWLWPWVQSRVACFSIGHQRQRRLWMMVGRDEENEEPFLDECDDEYDDEGFDDDVASKRSETVLRDLAAMRDARERAI